MGFLREAAVGFKTILADRSLRLLVGLYCAQTVVAGASLVFLVAIALDLLDLGNAGVGYLDSVMGIGAFVGGFVALLLAQRGRLALDFGIGVIFWAAPLLFIVISPTLAAAAACMLLIGLANSLVDVNAYTILQRVVPDEVMGRVFGAMESAIIGAMALGALLMPLLIATIGLRAGLAVIGISVSVATIFGLPGLRRIDATVLAPPGLDLLRSRGDPRSASGANTRAPCTSTRPGAVLGRRGRDRAGRQRRPRLLRRERVGRGHQGRPPHRAPRAGRGLR